MENKAKNHHKYMRYKFLLVIVLMTVVHNSIYGQVEKLSLIGEYEPQKTKDAVASTDTGGMQGDSIPILRMKVIELNEFQAKTLIMKRFKRIKIIDKSPITCLGLNIDNPTVYGKFIIVGDSIIIRAKYSIQHFNKLAPKRRVKTKLAKTFKFKIINENQLEISPNYSWIKVLSITKNKPH